MVRTSQGQEPQLESAVRSHGCYKTLQALTVEAEQVNISQTQLFPQTLQQKLCEIKLQLHSLHVLRHFIPQSQIAPGKADAYAEQKPREYNPSFKRRMLQQIPSM